jgi:hypothetical protein
MEWIQSHLGRSAEWTDWLYGAGGAACICGTWRGQGRFRIRWIGVLVLCLFPLVWEGAMVRMEIRAFPVLADPGATWSRRGWTLNGVRISALPREDFRIVSGSKAAKEQPASNPGAFRAPICSDWSRMEAFHTKIFWPASPPAVLAVRVDDRPGNPPYADRFQREFAVTQGWNAVCIPAHELGKTSGGRPLRLGTIRKWGVFLVSDMPFDYFLLGEVRLTLHQEPP